MKWMFAFVLTMAATSAWGQCPSEQFALEGSWQHMSAAPRNGTVIEVIQTWGIAPTYGLVRFPQKGSVFEQFNRGKSAVEDLTWEDVSNPTQGYTNLGNCLRWRPYKGDPKTYVDPTGGAQNTTAYWCQAAHAHYDSKHAKCYY